jgi:hypothetical protein
MKSLISTVILLLTACSSTPSGGFVEPGVPDAGNFGGGGMKDAAPVGHLRGRVMAPNGTIPIAGALVYLAEMKPAPSSEKVYCDECVKLGAGTVQAMSDASGNFDLAVQSAGKQFVVVQKGGFRRVREVSIIGGDDMLPAEFSTLPPKTNLAAGDEVPRMTVVHGTYDEIEASLKKLGVDPSAITVESEPLIGAAATKFLSDPAKVNSRHIIFLPCGDITQPLPNVDLSTDPVIQKNLVDFVNAGGRLYVTDWHYDFIARNFPAFIKFEGASTTACSGCGRTPYDAPPAQGVPSRLKQFGRAAMLPAPLRSVRPNRLLFALCLGALH